MEPIPPRSILCNAWHASRENTGTRASGLLKLLSVCRACVDSTPALQGPTNVCNAVLDRTTRGAGSLPVYCVIEGRSPRTNRRVYVLPVQPDALPALLELPCARFVPLERRPRVTCFPPRALNAIPGHMGRPLARSRASHVLPEPTRRFSGRPLWRCVKTAHPANTPGVSG